MDRLGWVLMKSAKPMMFLSLEKMTTLRSSNTIHRQEKQLNDSPTSQRHLRETTPPGKPPVLPIAILDL